MPRIGIAIFICAAVLVGHGVAQTVALDAKAALAAEWMDDKTAANGAAHCLRALDLYTADTPSPARAVLELVAGAPAANGAPDPGNLYPLAQDLGILLAALTNASRTVPTQKPDIDALFVTAGNRIGAFYVSDPGGLYREVSLQSSHNPARALFVLLSAHAADPAIMETFRTCYQIDRDRLFRLVSDHFR
jgi:hypothetical protein